MNQAQPQTAKHPLHIPRTFRLPPTPFRGLADHSPRVFSMIMHCAAGTHDLPSFAASPLLTELGHDQPCRLHRKALLLCSVAR